MTAYVTRRMFVRWLLGMPFLPMAPLWVREGKTEASDSDLGVRGSSIGAFFAGEDLTYSIGFWIFKEAALGRLGFAATGRTGIYVANLQTETLGILGFVARYRVDRYRSVMEEVEGGKRLRSLSFEEDVKVGSKLRKRVDLFDYHRQKWIIRKRRRDGTFSYQEEPIPAGMVYDDFVTASYNFRYGVYGPIQRGKKYTIPTFPRKRVTQYEVQVASEREEEKRRKAEEPKEGKDFFLRLYLDPEVTHSKKGLVEGWLSKDLLPIEGAIRDVILFGDVKGTLIKKG